MGDMIPMELTKMRPEHAKAFEPPEADELLRFRYTSYMGEFHPAEKKVVVDFCPADLDLTPVQQDKLKKLAGARYNPGKNIVHMSCELFEHQAQNKRYLGDLVNKLVAEAKVMFSGVKYFKASEADSRWLERTPKTPSRTSHWTLGITHSRRNPSSLRNGA